MTQILDGIRVLDFTRAFAGAFATRWLADMGAEVLKVEPPGGDGLRRSGMVQKEDGDWVPLMSGGDPPPGGFGAPFLYANAGKKSICIDMKREGALEVAKALASKADIVFENFTPHVLESWGMSYEELRKLKEDIILVSVTGFGQDSPDPNRVCLEPGAVAMAGFAYVNGPKNGRPMQNGFAIGDPVSATVSALAAVSALVHRLRTGQGQHVDISMVDAVLAMDCCVTPFTAMGTVDSPVMQPYRDFKPAAGGPSNPVAPPAGIFETRDGYVAIQVGGSGPDSWWGRLCQLMGREDLITAPDWSTAEARVERQEELWEIIESWLKREFTGAEEASEYISQHRLMAMPVLSPAETVRHPHFTRRGMIVQLDHPAAGKLATVATPVKFSEAPINVRRAPLVGEHNTDALNFWLGMSPLSVGELYDTGVLHHDNLIDALKEAGEL